MYLSDTELQALLPELRIATEQDAEPFSPEEQIRPASIDIRLSAVFWRPIRRFTIDLRRSQLLEIQPRRYYRKVTLEPGETIVLKTSELLLGRTLEEFTVPASCAGEITGRSSFARIGLMINCTGGYINPGWRGRMPLQLVNFSPNPIRLVAGIPICQVRLVKLSSQVERPYGHPDLFSIYLEDDGGPSYWWRDKRIRRLHSLLSARSVEQRIQNAVRAKVGAREPEVLERLERLIAKMRVDELQNAAQILESFARVEERRRTLRRWAINLCRGSFTVGITSSLWVANRLPPVLWWHWTVWSLALFLVCLSAYAFKAEVGDHFGLTELRAARGSEQAE